MATTSFCLFVIFISWEISDSPVSSTLYKTVNSVSNSDCAFTCPGDKKNKAEIKSNLSILGIVLMILEEPQIKKP